MRVMLATYSGDFEPAFDFQRGDAGADQLRQHFQSGQILRTQQILFGRPAAPVLPSAIKS